MRDIEKKIQYFKERRDKFRQGGSSEAVQRQHQRGKLTARERLELLFEPGSFTELNLLVTSPATDFGLDKVETYGDTAISGWGKINGRTVFVFTQDFTIAGGSWGDMHLRKQLHTMRQALEMQCPIIYMNDSGGMRPQEQHYNLPRGQGEHFFMWSTLSGVVPQISLVMGPVAGGPCYGPALTDFIILIKGTSSMFIGGPSVVKATTGEEVSEQELGGAEMHARVSGVASLVAQDDRDGIQKTRELLGFLPQNNLEKPPVAAISDDPARIDPDLWQLLPDHPAKSYDMHQIITRVVDNGNFFEIMPDYARNFITGFVRLNGNPVGILANQPAVYGGILDIDSSDKGARFIRFCDCFNIPMINFVDTPGYLVGTKMEQGGIIRHGAKLLYARSEATVPQLVVVVRKSLAGAQIAMCSKGLGADFVFAWPTAQFGVFGVDAGMAILLRSHYLKEKLAEAKDPEALIKQWRKEYEEKYLDIYKVGPYRHFDDMIDPADTRPALIRALEVALKKKIDRPWRKHGNMPL